MLHDPSRKSAAFQNTITDVGVYDIEVKSRADLRKVGASQYARDPSTEVLVVAFAISRIRSQGSSLL